MFKKLKRDDLNWLMIVLCIAGMFAALLWAGLTDPELQARRNGTWKPPSGSSYQHSEGRFFAEDPLDVRPNPQRDYERREGWHLNPLNGQWNPGLWTDAQHAIIWSDD